MPHSSSAAASVFCRDTANHLPTTSDAVACPYSPVRNGEHKFNHYARWDGQCDRTRAFCGPSGSRCSSQ